MVKTWMVGLPVLQPLSPRQDCRIGFAAFVCKYSMIFRCSLNQQNLFTLSQRKEKTFGQRKNTHPCLHASAGRKTFPKLDCLSCFLGFLSSCGAASGAATCWWRTSVSSPHPRPGPSYQGWCSHRRTELLAPTVCQRRTAMGGKSQKWVTTHVGSGKVSRSLMQSLPNSCCPWDSGGNAMCATQFLPPEMSSLSKEASAQLSKGKSNIWLMW